MSGQDFSQIIDRRHSQSVKWDFMAQYLGLEGDELLPMWVSDMDFRAPDPVLQALQQRVTHGVFGYSERDDSYYQAAIDWFAARHQLLLQRSWFSTIEGVLPGLALLIQMLSAPGEEVVIQSPCYGSFSKIIQLNGRRVLDNPLQQTEQGYRMDLQHLEQLLRTQRPPVLLLCNPHNPTGRCWSKEELSELMTLCERWSVTVLSDEIWADLLLPGSHFTSVLHLAQNYACPVVAATSASKTFALSSLRIANFLIPDQGLRSRFQQRLNAHGLDVFNVMAMSAATAAYQQGSQWLDNLLIYLADNRRALAAVLADPGCRLRLLPAEGTYLAWVDCRDLGLDDATLQQHLIEKTGIVPSMGLGFGALGSGFIRLNLGCPRPVLLEAAHKLFSLG
ncbi:MAG: MalY/PatB family protein [Enterobacteriaceae bacterium]